MPDFEAATAWWRPERPGPTEASRVPASSVAFWALVAFTAFLLVSPQVWFPVLKIFRLPFFAASLAIGAHLVDRTIRRRPVTPFHPETAIVFALVAWSILTIPLSYWPGGSVTVLTDHYLKAVVFFWLIGTLVTTSKRLRIFAWTLVLCSIPIAVTGLEHFHSGEYATKANAVVQRIAGYQGSGIAANPNDLALMLNLLIPIAGVLILTARRAAVRGLAAGVLLLSIAAVIVTFSRAGFVTLAAIFLMSLLGLARHRAPGAATAILVVALTIPPLLPAGYLERLDTITDMSADRTGSAQGRWNDFQVAAELVAENPVIGVGMGQDILGLNEQRGRASWRSVHNAYLQYAVDLGVPGLVLFLWFLALIFRNTRRIQVRSARDPALRNLHLFDEGVQIALVACIVAAFFHPIAYQFYFFAVAGLTVALKNTCRAEIASAPPALGHA